MVFSSLKVWIFDEFVRKVLKSTLQGISRMLLAAASTDS
jgi:hypothetical protein